jgi:hypothetical protein
MGHARRCNSSTRFWVSGISDLTVAKQYRHKLSVSDLRSKSPMGASGSFWLVIDEMHHYRR